jgi:predicted Rossmann-fold nucleotide-binding protein
MQIALSGKEDYLAILSEFMAENGLHKIIAFSGGADSEIAGVPSGDQLQKQYQGLASELEARKIREALNHLKDFRIAILTGGTVWGVPNTATLEAKKLGMKTIGIYPLAGKKYALSSDYLDVSICVEPLMGESRWGDESSIFTSLLDGVIVYGGGAGTLIECAHILKTNEALIKSGLPVKYIIPLSGTGGVADGLPFIWGKAEVRSRCMPFHKVSTGREAAHLLRDKLNLEDYLDL